MRKRIATLIAAMLLAMTMLGGVASAQGQAMTTVCQNPAGNEPQGQCEGQALTETVLNPAGHAPPGQQP